MHRSLAILILLLACDSRVTPLRPELNVFCVLRTDGSHPFVLVGRSVGFDSAHDRFDDWNGLADASVLVTRGRDSTRFRYVPETTGYYVADSLVARAGDAYLLIVNSPDGDEARGKTTVPHGFAIESAGIDTVAGTSNPSDSLAEVAMAWSPSDGAARYQSVATFLYARPGVDTASEWHGFETDTLSGRIWASLRKYQHGDTLPLCLVRLSICALDPNYADYLTMQRENGNCNTLMHIDGGVGVFGSISVAETTIYPTQPVSLATLGRSVRPTR